MLEFHKLFILVLGFEEIFALNSIHKKVLKNNSSSFTMHLWLVCKSSRNFRNNLQFVFNQTEYQYNSLYDLNSMFHYLWCNFTIIMCDFSSYSLLYKQNSKSSCCQKAWPEVCSQIWMKWKFQPVLTSFNQFRPVSPSYVWSDPCHLNTILVFWNPGILESWNPPISNIWEQTL